MELAAARLFRAKWSEQIHEEWIRNLLENRKDLTREKLERTKDLMNSAVPDALVTGHEDLIDALQLPDAGDRHVLAAAIKAGCGAIITFNLKHFPAAKLSKYNVEAQHPDEFIANQFSLDQAGVIIAAKRCRSRLKNPEKSAVDYLDTLQSQGLPKTVDLLSDYASIL